MVSGLCPGGRRRRNNGRLLFDIEEQAQAFFDKRELYERLKLRYRRGFLFVGASGTGKTMMLRHLMRRTYANHKIRTIMFNIRRDTDEDMVAGLFKYAAKCAPSMVILEDLDSLTKESKVTRSALLQELDGLTSKEGMLIIGTTNNPEEIDPALTHRPSRFDRVWHFPTPSTQLRWEYLTGELTGLSPDVVQEITRLTTGWSFAYRCALRIPPTPTNCASGSDQRDGEGPPRSPAMPLVQSHGD